MAKLVLLSAGLSGRTHELNVEKTTIGRLEDNTFQIAEPSVSSHHCEILLRGPEVVVKDLNSTNGTFIQGEKVSEKVLKPGETLRLGQIEMRLENGAPAPAPPASSTQAAGKRTDNLSVQRGVKFNELEQGTRTGVPGAGFSKKEDKVNRWFLIGGIIMGVIILGVLIYVFMTAGSGPSN